MSAFASLCLSYRRNERPSQFKKEDMEGSKERKEGKEPHENEERRIGEVMLHGGRE